MACEGAPTPPESEMDNKPIQSDTTETPTDNLKEGKLDPNNLNNICPEILTNIAKHIYRPSDLKSLCLTSKPLYNAAVKELYRTVSLEVGKRSDLRLSAFLKSSNAGLRNIRVLRVNFESRNSDMSDSDHSRVHTLVRMLIDYLPEHILEDFEWRPWLPFNQETYLLLLQKQQRLKWLTAFRLDESNVVEKLESKQSEYTELFKNCQKLAIYPDTVATLEMAHYFLGKIQNLKEIILHTNFTRGPTHISQRQLNDGPTGPGLVTNTLFGHFLQPDAEKSTPFANLTAVRLVEVGLRHCADTFGRIIDFTRVDTLRLAKCSGADALLSLLCKSSHLPRKLRYFEFQHDDNPDNDGLTALDDFLCLVEGIEEIYIDLTNVKTMPSVNGIVKHGKTLEILLVHASDTQLEQGEHVWSAEDFQNVCSSITKLEQLSCAWPATSVLRANSPSWDSYLYASRQLQHLITLHISSFPTCSPLKGNLEKSIYTELLRGLANQLLTDTPITMSLSKHLAVIAFGVSDKIPLRQDSIHQLIYLRSTLINADLKEEITAVPVSWAARQWIEPRSDVLDFELSNLRIKVPIRDYSNFMDDDTEDEMV